MGDGGRKPKKMYARPGCCALLWCFEMLLFFLTDEGNFNGIIIIIFASSLRSPPSIKLW
jgi:hypothetical protein